LWAGVDDDDGVEENMLPNLRYAIRSLARAPGYTVAFILTLGLGIGLNTAIFSVVNGVLLAPLPYKDADRIMYVRQPALQAGVQNISFSFMEVQDYREASRTLDQFVEYGDWTFNVVADDADPHRAVGGLVTSNYFSVLGLTPALGRVLGAQDDGEGAEPAMVLTHDYWTRAFGADPGILDRTVKLYAFAQPKTTRIVGVLEPGTHYTGSRRQDFFVNYATNDHYLGATMQDQRTHRMTDVFARLAPGQTPEAAQEELLALNEAQHEAAPEAYPEGRGLTIAAGLWQDELTRGARSTFLILMGTVGLVLLLACANVANLTLTRLIRRERELSVRAALGASRRRLRNQLLTENLVLSLAGAGLGLVLAVFGLGLLVEYANRFTVRTGEIGIDVTVLTFTMAVAVVIAVLLAWAPALPGVGDLGSAVAAAGSTRGAVGLPKKQLQRALVVGQLALSFTLLIGAALLVRSLINLTNVDTGIEYENVVAMQAPNITGLPPDENLVLMDQVIGGIREFPGVRSAAYASRAPFDPNVALQSLQFRVEGEDPDGMVSPMAAQNAVSPAYFQTVGLEIVKGRAFTATDDASSDSVAIINERMAAHLFGAEDPINRRISRQTFQGNWTPWARIVGVSADTRDHGLATANVHTVYVPAAQSFPGQALVVRTTGTPGPLGRRVAEIVRGLDADRPVDNITTLEDLRSEDMAPERLNATLFSAFALLALLIAAVGVLGVLAFTVSQRTQEFGVRMALGAQQGQVLGMVLREGAFMALAALLVGTAAAAFLSRFLVGLLFGVQGTDPATYALVGLVLGVVAIVAAYVPARRATRVDPMKALRSE
jgi:putative ABC transport system permease protein